MSTLVNLSLQNTSAPSVNERFYDHASFVMCSSCFWCASDLSGGSKITNKCHACNTADSLESIPLALNERYTFDNDQKRGIILDFEPSSKKTG